MTGSWPPDRQRYRIIRLNLECEAVCRKRLHVRAVAVDPPVLAYR